MNKHRIVVLLSDAELESWKQTAGEVPLSRWIRRRCNEAANQDVQLPQPGKAVKHENHHNQNLRRAKTVPAHRRSSRVDRGSAPVDSSRLGNTDAAKEKGACPHGIKKGWRCTLCGKVVE